ncbi:hypothetical protein TVAG_112810 [Trichomonas vaginalis G3]|uniref:Uncharacterized protein n=1 Tax=Trichomonas vaginalis (strain ATCC PRA-98 / G3) TaxID=412133 RepID=A2F728_TRIV3|nr:hypothetical protein TVAGG3_0258520 [Trichomonas vaginalis G3]EAX99265.1 hypothetical protein TVAG_112810 [Trichomonas vaginalis G3]KAI5524931.1 hypothetical protein TVAGG3_0258520 [Trichomonas vaginalis G3]|eukprot:XP_001312195.1 hypothetical protein [Trichomonas vaginalis G3]
MSTKENIDLSNVNPDMTVEDYLRKQCNNQIDRLKEHAEQLVQQFQQEAAEVREKLVQRLEQGSNC